MARRGMFARSLSASAIQLIGGLLIAVIIATSLARVTQTRDETLGTARQELDRVTLLVSEGLAVAMRNAKASLEVAQSCWLRGAEPAGAMATGAEVAGLMGELSNVMAAMPELTRLMVALPDGRMFGTGAPKAGAPPEPDDAIRALLSRAMAGGDAGLLIDRAPTGPADILVGRKIISRSGQMLGAAAVRVQPDVMRHLQALTPLAPGTVVTIARQDGAELWRFAAAGATPALVAPPLVAPPLVALHRLGGFPLVVASSRAQAPVLAKWHSAAMAIALDGLALALVVATMVLALLRQCRAYAALQATIASQAAASTARAHDDSQAQQARRLEVVGRLTAGVAHDYNNLLMSISGNLEFLESDPALGRLHSQRLAMIRQATDRGAGLTRQLLAASRKQLLQPRLVDLNALARRVAELTRQQCSGQMVQLELELREGLWGSVVDPAQIENVLLNLIHNAREALPHGGTIALRTENHRVWWQEQPDDPAAGDHAMLTVSDNGVGMRPEVLARACDPFFTTKQPGRGSGLGLSQVAGIIRQSGGTMRIDSTPGIGTTVRLYLPRATETRTAEAAARAHQAPPPEPGDAAPPIRVLVIDDDVAVLDIIVATLTAEGYEAIAATNGRTGLELLRARPDIGLLLVDFAMPEMNGAEVAREVRRHRPALPVTFMTGYADAGPLGSERFILQKPFRSGELLGMLRQALPMPQQVN